MSTTRNSVIVGALLRRNFRAAFDELNIRYTEHKGLLDSIFVFEADDRQFARLSRWAKQFED